MKLSVLDHVQVARPCPASWDEMVGDDRVRHCSLCALNVYDLSAMRRDEAEQLLLATEGRLCVRFYRRADGTVMTQDCPRGLAAVRRRLAVWWTAVAAALGIMVSSPTCTRDVPVRVLQGTPAPAQSSGHKHQSEMAPTMGRPAATTQPTTRPKL